MRFLGWFCPWTIGAAWSLKKPIAEAPRMQRIAEKAKAESADLDRHG
jgi:hypothetical protein